MCGQLFGTLGAFGGDDDPFFGEEILPQFRHGNPPASSIGRKSPALQFLVNEDRQLLRYAGK
jgi:hypothetical protein